MSKKVGWITLLGRPNVGKSTLLNTLLQTPLSLVTPKAQTTRDRILGIFTAAEGQMLFTDTPGIHRARKEGGLNSYMLNEARISLQAPDLIWYLVDPASELKHEERVLEFLGENLKNTKPPLMLIMNKEDQYTGTDRLSRLQNVLENVLQEKQLHYQASFVISAVTQKGLPTLIQKSWEYLPEGEPEYSDADQISDRPMRFFVSEIIRGRLFELLGDEIPYSCAVQIENYLETTSPIRIEATIHVERESQKGIVIGQGGKKIKAIGQSARLAIEALVGQQIFLGLKVKVSPHWSENTGLLQKLGYSFRGKK